MMRLSLLRAHSSRGKKSWLEIPVADEVYHIDTAMFIFLENGQVHLNKWSECFFSNDLSVCLLFSNTWLDILYIIHSKPH